MIEKRKSSFLSFWQGSDKVVRCEGWVRAEKIPPRQTAGNSPCKHADSTLHLSRFLPAFAIRGHDHKMNGLVLFDILVRTDGRAVVRVSLLLHG